MRTFPIFLISFLILLTFELKWSSALIFMRNVAIGNLIALAIPLWTEDPFLSNVFMSYNFESNYAGPTSAPDITNLYLDKFQLPYDKFDSELDDYRRRPLGGVRRSISNTVPEMRQQITRKNVYRVIESYSSKSCLLRSICEAAITPFSKHNGILGDVFHILLTPSTSSHEDGMSHEYHIAEEYGWKNGNCLEFESACPSNGLDLFTKYF